MQDCTYSRPTSDSLCCIGICLPWACATILFLSEGLASEFYVCFLVFFSLQRSLLFYLPLLCRLPFLQLNFWVVHFCASKFLAIDSSVLGCIFHYEAWGANFFFVSCYLLYSPTSPKIWIEPENGWDFDWCIVLQREVVNVSWMFSCSRGRRVNLKFHLSLHSLVKGDFILLGQVLLSSWCMWTA